MRNTIIGFAVMLAYFIVLGGLFYFLVNIMVELAAAVMVVIS